MRTPTQRRKPRKTELASFPVPTAGLISNRNLAIPVGQSVPPGAAILENWFPTPSSVILRRGMIRHATMPDDETVKSIFTYVLGGTERMFAATDDGIWDVTSVSDPETDPGTLVYDGVTNGDWVVLQFSTAGGTFLIGVNGVDPGFIYDGTSFWPYVDGGVTELTVTESTPFVIGEVVTGGTSGATGTVWGTGTGVLFLINVTGDFEPEAITGSIAGAGTIDATPSLAAPGLDGVNTADLTYVWSYKQRVWFTEKGKLDAWYLSVDQVGGAATVLPLGGVFNRGGTLLWGHTWSLDSGGDGGLSEQCVFTTTEGEVAAYQGLSPDDAQTWSKVGVYRIGRPMGKKAFIRAGGDLVIATSIGFIPLGQAIQRDYAALGLIAVSQPIADEWRRAVTERGMENWQCELWGEGSMTLIAPPTANTQSPVVFVANSDSGAWSVFTNWHVTALKTFRGRLFMGSTLGRVREGWIGGTDEGIPYTGVVMPLFNDLGSPGQRKFAEIARVVKRSSFEVNETVAARFDWNMNVPVQPDSPSIPAGSEWDLGLWNDAKWDTARDTVVTSKWVSVGGSGYAATLIALVTSGSILPLDVEIVRFDLSYGTGDIIT